MPVLVTNQSSNPPREEPTEDPDETSSYNGDNYPAHSPAQNEPVVRNKFFVARKFIRFRRIYLKFSMNLFPTMAMREVHPILRIIFSIY